MASTNKTNSNIKSRSRSSYRSEKPLHTYTPQSHENLLKQFSKMSLKRNDVKTLKKEINRLKVELKKADMEMKLKEDRIQLLETTLLNKNTLPSKDYNMVFKPGEGKLKAEDNSENILSEHFSEVMRRNQETLEQKDRRIKELQARLAQVMNKDQDSSEKQIGCQDLGLQTSVCNRSPRAGATNTIYKNDRNKEAVNGVNIEERQNTTPINMARTQTETGEYSNLDRLQQYFMKRLDFEEELDTLFWEIEKTRFAMLQHNTEYDCDQRRAYEKEFEVFRKTRDQLLKELGGMRAAYNKMIMPNAKATFLYKR